MATRQIKNAFAVCLILLLNLAHPAAGGAKTFLDDVAGMSAYFSFTGPTSLSSNLLLNQFRVVEDVQPSYLLGSVPCVGFESDSSQDAKVFVHNAGWVVAFFPKDRPISQVIDQPMESSTRLDKVLAKIAYAVDVANYSTAYTHFQHQSAEKMLRVGRIRDNVAGENTMDLRLSASNLYYEMGWMLQTKSTWAHGWLDVDQVRLAETPWGNGSPIQTGRLSPGQFVPNARHVVTVGLYVSQWGYSYGEMDVLLSGPAGMSITGADWSSTLPLHPSPTELQTAAADVPRFLEIFLPLAVH